VAQLGGVVPTDAATSDKAAALRDELAAEMTPAQIAEAQRMAREWKPTKVSQRRTIRINGGSANASNVHVMFIGIGAKSA
jgi:hypothetical protein